MRNNGALKLLSIELACFAWQLEAKVFLEKHSNV